MRKAKAPKKTAKKTAKKIAKKAGRKVTAKTKGRQAAVKTKAKPARRATASFTGDQILGEIMFVLPVLSGDNLRTLRDVINKQLKEIGEGDTEEVGQVAAPEAVEVPAPAAEPETAPPPAEPPSIGVLADNPSGFGKAFEQATPGDGEEKDEPAEEPATTSN